MGMHANTDVTPARKVTAEVLNLIGINVGRIHLDRGGEVDDHRPGGRGFPDIRHRLADLQGKVRFGEAERFRRIFVAPAGLGVSLAQGADLTCGADGQLHDLLFALAKHQLAEQRRGGVIEMHRGAFGTFKRGKGALNQIAAGLGEHLNGHVVRDPLLLNQLTDKLKVRL